MGRPNLNMAARWLARADLPGRVAVGWSGGADSTALLLALLEEGHQVVAWHVDHGWHSDSSMVAECLRNRAAGWGVEFHCARVAGNSGRNREAVARHARFEQFLSWSREQGVNALCLAQQRDDQAETVCMRMLQGAGPAGCVGIRKKRVWQGLEIFRPLLHVPRSDIELALQAAEVDWSDDASNRDTRLLRNRIRHELFGAARRVGTDPVELFNRWQAQAARLRQRLDGMADAVAVNMHQGSAVVAWEDWRSSPAAVRAVVLQRMNARLFGEGAVLGRRHILLAEAWRGKGARRGIDLSRCRLYRSRETLHLAPAEVNLHG